MKIVTCVAPVNIAVIKYWGKSNDELIIPLNDSISASLSTDVMCAKTTIMASPLLNESAFWLNGAKQDMNSPRLARCLKKVRERADPSLPEASWNVVICSENNFPTAAGLASSAAGFACLVYALAVLYGVEGEISDVARQGSGSACRSMYGGWVRWHCQGDSIARQLKGPAHWPEMRVLILVVNDATKKHSSTLGMKRSVDTSSLIGYRAEKVVPDRIRDMEGAIFAKDFETFAELTMRDSNQFHAICLDTYPPCVYMNDTSHAIVDLVHRYNEFRGRNAACYTFDAGPNACVFLLEQEVSSFAGAVDYAFPRVGDGADYYKGLGFERVPIEGGLAETLTPAEQGKLKYMIHTEVGEGPRVLENSDDHLLTVDGLPKALGLVPA
ncbi:diphosphomevalonate decarboxylase isoform X2 [Cylas formicarius]|uniref:diphosphomevalonate decarboxylase isoform X2 n=1 Tax=Cylas formicarius TaxID=197179 RepID=UPI002958AC8A|nr:diphosphomevalonate decarboxylase isoform X2 [Cylas formicarius]